MTSRGYLTLALCALVLAALAAVRLFRSDGPVDVQQMRFDATRPILAALPYRELRSEADINEIIAKMEFIHPATVNPEQISRLRETLSRFLILQYVDDDADAYANWRQSEGYALRTVADIDNDGWPLEMSRTYLLDHFDDGQALAPELTGDARRDFAQFWRVSHHVGAGANRPVAVADSPTGLLTVIGRSTSGNPGRPRLENDLPAEAWYGGITTGGRRWWNAVPSLDRIVQQQETFVAQTGIVFRYGSGTMRPLLLTHYWDPAAQRWLLMSATVTNYPANESVWPVEF